jgi:short-subunit dehydrogenase
MKRNVLIIGATSAIAIACARIWASRGDSLFLVARDETKLADVAADLSARGASVTGTYTLDSRDATKHQAMLEAFLTSSPQLDIALMAHGTLPNQAQCQADVDLAMAEFANNGTSVIALLSLLANQVERQRYGTLAVISSVAGDRGRPSNYLYGSAKAAVTVFSDGLRARLTKVGGHVITIKPGFVATPMTKGLPLPQKLVASPETVAEQITRAIEKRKNTIYTPGFWRLIMLIIKSIPEPIFKKLNL